jgi:broad specificity phosphatase PhoE
MGLPREIVLVRHGETAGQSSVRLFGATDIPLAPLGERQAHAAGVALRGRSFDAIVTSPLVRARRSCEMVLAGMGIPGDREPTCLEGFREIDFGEWEGLTLAEIAERAPQAQIRWRTEGATFMFPGGESREGFLRRVHQTIPLAFDRHFAEGATSILAVLHKGVIKAVLNHLLRVDFEELQRTPVELGSIHRLEHQGDHWQLVEHNRVDHLGDELRMPGS